MDKWKRICGTNQLSRNSIRVLHSCCTVCVMNRWNSFLFEETTPSFYFIIMTWFDWIWSLKWENFLPPLVGSGSITSLNRVASPTVGWTILSWYEMHLLIKQNSCFSDLVKQPYKAYKRMWLKYTVSLLAAGYFWSQPLGVAQQAVNTIESANAKILLIHTFSIYSLTLLFRSFHLMNIFLLFF